MSLNVRSSTPHPTGTQQLIKGNTVCHCRLQSNTNVSNLAVRLMARIVMFCKNYMAISLPSKMTMRNI